MHDKLKLPLTAVFSFLLGGVVFFPWGAGQEFKREISGGSNSTFIFDKSTTKEQVLTLAVKKLDYELSADEIKSSNLAITKQLNSYRAYVDDSVIDQVETKNNIKPVIIVEYRFSEDELQLSNSAIKNQLKKTIIGPTSVDSNRQAVSIPKIKDISNNDIGKSYGTIIVEYRFSSEEIKHSNLAIQKQLKHLTVADTDEQEIVSNDNIITEENEKLENTKNTISVTKSEYNFSSEEMESSNLAIKKQLSRYLANNNLIESNSDEFEISEKSETDLFVSNTPEYTNDTDESTEPDSVEVEYQKIKFSESGLKISNLAILKQLRSYSDNLSKNDESNEIVSNLDELEIEPIDSSNSNFPSTNNISNLEVKSDYEDEDEDESELLISNTEHDDDDYSNIPEKLNSNKQFRKNSLTSITSNDILDDAAENEEEDDDDEYSSERIEFNSEPQYFTESFDVKATIAIEDNIETPNVEGIIKNTFDNIVADELEMIEEIDITDDTNSIVSSENNPN